MEDEDGCIFTPASDKQYTVFAPNPLGGADWPPSSFSPQTGYMYICSKDGVAAWKDMWPNDMCYSGVMTTAGNLTFVGRNGGRLQAYDSRNGKLLWTSPKLAAGVNAPAVTYSANGKQYVAVFAGGNGIASSFGGVKPNYGSELYAFALPG